MAHGYARPSTFTSTSSRSHHPRALDTVSTQSLLEAVHAAYTASKPYNLDATTSLVVNSWLQTSGDGSHGRQAVVDGDLARKAWEHARRRAEDGCIVLASPHDSTPSLIVPFLSALPFSIPSTIHSAITALQPFLRCTTPKNHAAYRCSSFAATFTFGLGTGIITGATLRLSDSGIDTNTGLVNIPAEHGYRAFDVFYYLLSSAASQAEREFLNLHEPAAYTLLKKSGTFSPPSYLPTADDSASAEGFRLALKSIGITGNAKRNLLSVLAALLKLGETLDVLVSEDQLEHMCEEAATILELNPTVLAQNCSAADREILIGGIYEALVDWVIAKANLAILKEVTDSGEVRFRAHEDTASPSDDNSDAVNITVLEISNPGLGKALALRTMFDDMDGINSEMKEDGVPVASVPHSVVLEMRTAVSENASEFGLTATKAGLEKVLIREQREVLLDRIGQETEASSFLKTILYPVTAEGNLPGRATRFDLVTLVGGSRAWFHLCIHPTDELPLNSDSSTAISWSASSPLRQLRCWRLVDWFNWRKKNTDFTADFDLEEFATRYERLGCRDGRDSVESFVLERGWSNGEAVVGHDRIWIRENAWWDIESMLDMLAVQSTYDDHDRDVDNSYIDSPYGNLGTLQDSREDLLQRNYAQNFDARNNFCGQSLAPNTAHTIRTDVGGDYGLGRDGDVYKFDEYHDDDGETGVAKVVTEEPITRSRRVWVAVTWALTFWIPSLALRIFGRMKRPDIRMAWREKFVLVLIIVFINVFVIFYIVEFGRLLCPNYDTVWNTREVNEHLGGDDFYVSVRGRVYDISKFWKLQHSSITSLQVSDSLMKPLAGLNLDQLFPIPLYVGCSGLVTDKTVILQNNDSSLSTTAFVHTSGYLSPYTTSDLASGYWYNDTFLPRMKNYYKGDLVTAQKTIQSEGVNDAHMWVIIDNKVYDLTNYFYTLTYLSGVPGYNFLDDTLVTLVQENPGSDITTQYNAWFQKNSSVAYENLKCLENVFYIGKTDFRDTPRCQINNYILLAFTIVLCAVILVKFFAALQLGSKKRPAAQDKFVICQVPAYTEGEDHLRKGLDSLASLAYDNKKKLICVICDGMVTGGGNDRPTPKIVLDILGVDPRIDPPALPFKSVGSGNEQLNYGKVYSGLYEFEGNVVPYLVVVKVGKKSEQQSRKPGNRGKRDSQILLMRFLNRVHHRSPLSPLELEIFYQINNIIGVSPELYEYLFMVDADTMVMEDSLTRLVASCANDANIAGICGETSLENEKKSWTTMIQVYEYYISHHLAKAFESLFGSVTCLPGCFCMYRLRTADKRKPLIISDKIIQEYSDCEVDTLHKKNLLSLGEDRYLTTLMTKHFPQMHYKFVPNARALTAAPETWSILLSQRRRWINSTIHNLAELVLLKDMCGACFFSMRFVVFIDLFGTVILPATCCYLVYLIYRVATHQGGLPLVSLIMLGGVYGLQAFIFLIKRQWQHLGWMVVYLLAFPVYSFILPVYSFWKQDDFSWGNTRVVIGEKGGKQVVAEDQERFDPRSIPLQRWDDYAMVKGLPGQSGYQEAEKEGDGTYDDGYEMDEMRSQYSMNMPASTILTALKSHHASAYIPPRSPGPDPIRPQPQQRQSTYSHATRYTDGLTKYNFPQHSRNSSYGNYSEPSRIRQSQLSPSPNRGASNSYPSTETLAPYNFPPSGSIMHSTDVNQSARRSQVSIGYSRPGSTINFPPVHRLDSGVNSGGPTDAHIVEVVRACLGTVDLDSVTKKQLRALAEQRLHCTLGPERRIFLDDMIDAELAVM